MRILAAMGVPANVAGFGELDSFDLHHTILIVPQAAAGSLTASEISALTVKVNRGLNLITEGDTALARGLGITFLGRQLEMSEISDLHHPEIEILWKEKKVVPEIARSGLTVFAADANSGVPVLSGGALGEGKFLFLGAPLGEPGLFGYERFPFFHEAFHDLFGCLPLLKRPVLTTYVDWGYHTDDDPLELAARLRNQGISEVHLSSWYEPASCGEAFSRFIRACHSQGILVYTWLELPMVSKKFWDQHPQWREKTAAGRDAKVDWRYLMALEIPECREAVFEKIRQSFDRYEWDGIDLAELYFESPLGLERPDLFTPMSAWVRQDYRQKTGIDPRTLFSPANAHSPKKDTTMIDRFLDYRADLCLEINRRLIHFFNSQKIRPFGRAPDILLTLVDAVIDPRMKASIGIDTQKFLRLQKQIGFSLQVEDPFTLWALGPDRYRVLGAAYRRLMSPGSRLSIDINVVERSDTLYPNPKQTGLEFLCLIHQAALHADQVCIYADNTPNAFDFKFVPPALAGRARATPLSPGRFRLATPFNVILDIPTPGMRFMLNGREWPCVSDRGVIIPPGKHLLEAIPEQDGWKKYFITRITAPIRSCSRIGNNIRLEYRDRCNALVSLNFQPQRIFLNGIDASLPMYENQGSYTVLCPSGSNTIIFEAPQILGFRGPGRKARGAR